MDQTIRETIRTDLAHYTERIHLGAIIGKHAAPFFVLDPLLIKKQYTALQVALPGVQFYYALKALNHPAVIKAIQDCAGYLDVATAGELAIVQAAGFPLDHCMQTHPIKKPAEIAGAYAAGIRRFVVENQAELDKFTDAFTDAELLVRLRYTNPGAKSDLSYKFGASSIEAKQLVQRAHAAGRQVAGFCLHVGSQIDTAEAYRLAIGETIQLMDELKQELGIRFSVLDIGGGFPVLYRDAVPTITEIARIVRPLIEPLQKEMTILAEPGRYIAAPAMLLVASVAGKNTRFGKSWYYLDEGVYGAYSNIIFEQVQPQFFAYKELATKRPLPLQSCVLAGPTCDSVDVLDTDYALPGLDLGDLVISPTMGAYTTVSATTFNSIPKSAIVVVGS
ncbi:MAG TPA: type III PLP-dependent enzyme [Candidatus Saccharimonadales bacterium]|nr:type III PLP-dependent enzyme [Candidatus Saccharimonadales bacterium]